FANNGTGLEIEACPHFGWPPPMTAAVTGCSFRDNRLAGEIGCGWDGSPSFLHWLVLRGNSARGTGINALRMSGAFTGDTSLGVSQGLAYDFIGMKVPEGSSLILDPGAVVKSTGGLVCSGRLDARGTQSQPIIFTSPKD